MQKEKSDHSTTFDSIPDSKLFLYIEEVKKQNQYLKKALQTAQNLIQNYQKQNARLSTQIQIFNSKIRKTQLKKNVENQIAMQIRQENNKRQIALIQKQNKQFSQQIELLNAKIRQFITTQDKYQQKINVMQHKIKLLQRNQLQDRTNKQCPSLHIDVSNDVFCIPAAPQRRTDKKPKNISQLRQFHMRLKNKEQQYNNIPEKAKNLGIVQRVFSKQSIRDYSSVSSTKKKRPESSLSVKKK